MLLEPSRHPATKAATTAEAAEAERQTFRRERETLPEVNVSSSGL